MDGNLNNMILPPFLLHQLYSTGITNPGYSEKVQQEGRDIVYEGENKSHILIAIDQPDSLNDEEKGMLENLMKACEIGWGDVAFVNLSGQNFSLEEVVRQLKISRAVLFGISADVAGAVITGQEDRALIINDKIFIKTIPVSRLVHDVHRKKTLWSALKQMFNL